LKRTGRNPRFFLDPSVDNFVDNYQVKNLSVKFISFIFELSNQNNMNIKQTDIRLMEINARLRKILDKVNELKGEKISLIFKLEHDDVHPILFMLKSQALDFECMLLGEETEVLKAEFESTKMVAEMGLDFSKEEF
jgi:hypothetical protein